MDRIRNATDPYMKILFAHQYFGALGGAETNIHLTATELQKRGHSVALLHVTETGRGTESWHEIFPTRFQLSASDIPGCIASALDSFDPDLIYLHVLPNVEAVETLLGSSVPVIRMVHDHSLYCPRSYKYNPLTRATCHRPASAYCIFPCMAQIARNRNSFFPLKWAGLAAHRRELELSKQCEQIIVYSEYSKTELERNGFNPKKIQIHVPIRCWSDGPVASFSERNLILFAGQIIRGKGVDLLLKALSRLRVRFECLILGDGNYRPHCQRLCTRLNLADRVQFRGFVAADELQNFYLDASVFVVPSVWPEPFGMVGPEAMRYGLPVVAFDSGGIREWLTHSENGFLAPWKDVDALALRIEELLRNKALARRLGQNGLKRVNRVYSAPRQVDTLERLFLKVTREASHRLTRFLPEPNASSPAVAEISDFSAFPTSKSVEALTRPT